MTPEQKAQLIFAIVMITARELWAWVSANRQKLPPFIRKYVKQEYEMVIEQWVNDASMMFPYSDDLTPEQKADLGKLRRQFVLDRFIALNESQKLGLSEQLMKSIIEMVWTFIQQRLKK